MIMKALKRREVACIWKENHLVWVSWTKFAYMKSLPQKFSKTNDLSVDSEDQLFYFGTPGTQIWKYLEKSSDPDNDSWIFPFTVFLLFHYFNKPNKNSAVVISSKCWSPVLICQSKCPFSNHVHLDILTY